MSEQPNRKAFARARNAAASATVKPAGYDFTPALRRARRDGWTAERQTGFIDALAECGCVTEACARVGMSVASAYKLRRVAEAQSFRTAWDAALDHAIGRLSDAAFGRALNGVTRPVFFQGEQVGERRYYDERLTMFLLRYRDPLRYAKTLDEMIYSGSKAGAAYRLYRATRLVDEDARIAAAGEEEDESMGDVP
jgi:hypothetical protein